jgi:hypothetical protein
MQKEWSLVVMERSVEFKGGGLLMFLVFDLLYGYSDVNHGGVKIATGLIRSLIILNS